MIAKYSKDKENKKLTKLITEENEFKRNDPFYIREQARLEKLKKKEEA